MRFLFEGIKQRTRYLKKHYCVNRYQRPDWLIEVTRVFRLLTLIMVPLWIFQCYVRAALVYHKCEVFVPNSLQWSIAFRVSKLYRTKGANRPKISKLNRSLKKKKWLDSYVRIPNRVISSSFPLQLNSGETNCQRTATKDSWTRLFIYFSL